MRKSDRQDEEGTSAPLISVRIPSYNHAAYIGQALTSVLDDPYPNKEIVIVDDASTDRSDEVIRAWIAVNGDRIAVKYFRREVNQGIARTINQAIACCTGEYIVSLASDDFLLPGGIHERCRYLSDNPHKMAVFADCIVVDRDGRLLADSGLTGFHRADIRRLGTDSGIRREFILNWSVPGPVLMLRRGILERVGEYDERRLIEDWDFYLRMAAANLIGFVDAKVSAYRVHGNNTCMQPATSARKIASCKEMRKILLKNMPLFGLKDNFYMIGKLARVTRRQLKLKLRGWRGRDD